MEVEDIKQEVENLRFMIKDKMIMNDKELDQTIEKDDADYE
jgi:hypothetical protein